MALRKSEEGFSVLCSGLPECWSQGETEAEALENFADAIGAYLEVAADLAEEGAELRDIDVTAQTCRSSRGSTTATQ